MKIKILLLLLFFGLSEIQAQKKIEVLEDSKYWMKYNATIEKKLNLKDLQKTTEDFYFRLSYDGIKIDIWKDSLNNTNGIISNYIFQEKKNIPTDTIVKKIILQQTEADSVYSLIQESTILDLSTDREIKGWEFGKDGTTYEIQYADSQKYTYKSYWTPSSQDSLKEALLVHNFMESIKKQFDLEYKYEEFMNDLPAGTYSNGGTWARYISPDQYFNLELYGSYRFPFGIGASYYQNKIKKKSIQAGIAAVFLNHNFKDSYSFESWIYKYNFLIHKNSISDKITLGYKSRKLNYIGLSSNLENFTLRYVLGFDKIADFQIGFDHLTTQNLDKNGVVFGVGKQIKYIKTYVYSEVYYYNASLYNYAIGLSKSILTNWKWLDIISTHLYYEKLFNFEGLNFSVGIPLNH